MIKWLFFACSQENVKNVVFFEEFLFYHIVIINFYFVFSAIERQKNKLVELFLIILFWVPVASTATEFIFF